MKDFLIVGNWKENKTLGEALMWSKEVLPKLKKIKRVRVVVCPPFVLIPAFATLFDNQPLQVGAQDLSEFVRGTYTGEVSAEALRGFITYTIVGHSERRRALGERNKNIAAKVKNALCFGIRPIVCVSDKVDLEGAIFNGEAGFNEQNFQNQITSVFEELPPKEQKKVIFCYEPPTAISKPIGPIGVGQAAAVSEVEKMAKIIQKTAPTNLILYGGSVKSDNVLDFLQSPILDGVMPGSASLNAQEFSELVLRVEKANQ